MQRKRTPAEVIPIEADGERPDPEKLSFLWFPA
jgi:hypothetical protein